MIAAEEPAARGLNLRGTPIVYSEKARSPEAWAINSVARPGIRLAPRSGAASTRRSLFFVG